MNDPAEPLRVLPPLESHRRRPAIFQRHLPQPRATLSPSSRSTATAQRRPWLEPWLGPSPGWPRSMEWASGKDRAHGAAIAQPSPISPYVPPPLRRGPISGGITSQLAQFQVAGACSPALPPALPSALPWLQPCPTSRPASSPRSSHVSSPASSPTLAPGLPPARPGG